METESAWVTVAEICEVDMDAYAEAFDATRETIENSLNDVPGLEVIGTEGKVATVRVCTRMNQHHSTVFASLKSAVNARARLK